LGASPSHAWQEYPPRYERAPATCCGIAPKGHNGGVTMPETQPQDAPLDKRWLADAIERALNEDLGGNPGRDVTTQATISVDAVVTGELVAREGGVLAGIDVLDEILRQVAGRWDLPVPRVVVLVSDGETVKSGDVIAEIAGLGRVILTAERTLLNLMSHAAGIATHARQWTDALAGTSARVLDTRKTTPMLRELEKYAVRCGGGVNKRMGLFDVALIKDNHVVAVGGVAEAIVAVTTRFPGVAVQVEVERLAQAHEAIDAGARFLMLDNMSDSAMVEVVREVRAREGEVGRVEIEATGGLTIERAAAVAATGVDYLSVGALTHSSPALDLALDLH
jgi:nicotinate-nucleotide pyrophosphorylase (carboxylating)